MTNDPLQPGWITITEAIALTGYSGAHLRRLGKAARVPARKVGPVWTFQREALLNWQRSARSGPKRQTETYRK